MWSLLWAFNGLMAPSAAPSLHRSLLLAKLQFGVARAIGIMINTLLGGHCNIGGEWTSKLLGGPKFGTRPVPGGMVAWPQAIESKHISGQQFAQLWQKFAVVCIKCSLENGEWRMSAGGQKSCCRTTENVSCLLQTMCNLCQAHVTITQAQTRTVFTVQ